MPLPSSSCQFLPFFRASFALPIPSSSLNLTASPEEARRVSPLRGPAIEAPVPWGGRKGCRDCDSESLCWVFLPLPASIPFLFPANTLRNSERSRQLFALGFRSCKNWGWKRDAEIRGRTLRERSRTVARRSIFIREPGFQIGCCEDCKWRTCP